MFLCTVVESVYLLYMFNLFKTTVSVNHPFEEMYNGKIHNFLTHPINNGVYSSKICKLGKLVSVAVVVYWIIRLFLFCTDTDMYNTFTKYNRMLFASIFVGCFMNLNAVVYITPVVLFEILFLSC